jgi:predicted peroxiredoxin
MARSLLVKVTCGTDDPERANQGLTVAAAAVAAGVPVSLWLTGEGAFLVASGERRTADLGLEHASVAGDLVDAVLAGGAVTLCTQCAARRGIGEGDVLAGVRVAGAAAFVEEALADGTQALVY